MSARQLIILAIAAIAAIAALLLIRVSGSSEAQPASVPTEVIAGDMVLVVSRDIPQGAALTPSDLETRLFPAASVNENFVNLTQQPSAQAEYVGAVTRRPFVKGEPIVDGSVLQPEGRGFMAAQLDPGFRAIAIEIESFTSVGGYIQPNDRVDVIMTAEIDTQEERNVIVSEIVLHDIRVLALDDVVQPQTSGDAPQRNTAAVAVLEVTAEDARALALADGRGDLTLALRGVEMEMVGLQTPRAQREVDGNGGTVRVHAFGSVQDGGN